MRYPALLQFSLCLAVTSVLAQSPAQPADTGMVLRVSVPLETAIPGPLYVAVQNDDRIEVLPSGKTWSGTEQAHYTALGPDGRQLLVSGFETGNVYLVDTGSGEVSATFEIGSLAQGVKISPDGRYGVAMAAQRGVMVVIDLVSQEIVKEIEVGKMPHNARFSEDDERAYVTLQGDGAIAVVDMQTLEKRREIATPGIDTPHNLDLGLQGRYLWIRDFVGKVGVLDLNDDTMVRILEVGNAHGGIDVMPDGKHVATTSIADSHVTLLDAEYFDTVARIEVGQGPHGVRGSVDGHYLYTAVTGEDAIVVIDVQTLAVVRRELVGAFPFWIALPRNR
jgi:DNA-binding beta-propeller fold protein YncE